LVPLKVTVAIPATLRQYTHSNSEVNLEAFTVEELISSLDSMFPGLKAFILDESRQVRRYVNIFVNKDDIRSGNGLMTRLKDGDRVQIIPAVAGG
jgi:molybdopterin synthase sulfur carrier subunit